VRVFLEPYVLSGLGRVSDIASYSVYKLALLPRNTYFLILYSTPSQNPKTFCARCYENSFLASLQDSNLLEEAFCLSLSLGIQKREMWDTAMSLALPKPRKRLVLLWHGPTFENWISPGHDLLLLYSSKTCNNAHYMLRTGPLFLKI
jgi:hypothetical protein